MSYLLDVLKYVLPSLVVFATAYYLIRLFLNNDQKKRETDIKMAGYKIITPIRLQAYERITLFLERISPESLVMRVHRPDLTVGKLQAKLVQNIREEFEHNLSQQVYVTSKAWEIVKTAKEDMIAIVNKAAASLPENATATDLSQKIFELSVATDKSAVKNALEFIKNEIRITF